MAKNNENEIERIKLTEDQIDEICSEIEHQWLYLLMTRAVFPSYFPSHNTYKSPPFYSRLGLKFTVTLPERKTAAFKRGAEGLTNWLNQNFVIRLYGLLERYHIMYSGRKGYKNELMILLYELRPKIGAHSSGRLANDRKHLRMATELINKLFNKDIVVEDVQHYSLPVDSVLSPMKDMAIGFVKSLK